MDVDDLKELAGLRALVEGAGLSGQARHTALWCLDRLPALYGSLRQTDEQRFADGIRRLAQALIKELPGHEEAVVAGLRALHQRLGLQELPLHPERRRPRKAG